MKNNLRDVLKDAQADHGGTMGDYTVLSSHNDPFRVDTPIGHRNGRWLAEIIDRFVPAGETVHLRGLHYKCNGNVAKPDGTPYINDDATWTWISEKAAKHARWLGYVGWDRIHDQRNDAPTVRVWAPEPVDAYLSVDIDIEIPDVEDLLPTIAIENFVGEQPFKIVLFGEKSSLSPVLAPLAGDRHADLYLASGEISDTLLYGMASRGAEDGRPMVVLCFSDCDPAGWQMPISISRKLQAFAEGTFTDLEVEVVRVALTPEQVGEYGLPSTPLKEKELRAANWTERKGVEQTEIDALIALDRGAFAALARAAVAPYFDTTLDRRVREVRDAWLTAAQSAVNDQLGPQRREEIHRATTEQVAAMNEAVEALREQLHIDVDEFELPAIPDIPEHDVDPYGLPSPLFDSRWGFAEGSIALKASKAYEGDE